MKFWAALVAIGIVGGFALQLVEARNYQDYQSRCKGVEISYLKAMVPARGIHGDSFLTRRECRE